MHRFDLSYTSCNFLNSEHFYVDSVVFNQTSKETAPTVKEVWLGKVWLKNQESLHLPTKHSCRIRNLENKI